MLCAVIVDKAMRTGVVGSTVMSEPTRLSFVDKTSAAVERRGRSRKPFSLIQSSSYILLR